MAYQEARERIRDVLKDISITDPVSMEIVRVYEDPPPALEDLPCFVLFGDAGDVFEFGAGGGGHSETVTERVTLFVADESFQDAGRYVRAFRAAFVEAFKSEAGLDGHGEIQRITWERRTGFEYPRESRKHYIGQNYFITFHVLVP